MASLIDIVLAVLGAVIPQDAHGYALPAPTLAAPRHTVYAECGAGDLPFRMVGRNGFVHSMDTELCRDR